MYSLIDYNYELPEELISQAPTEQRDRSRLLLLNRGTGRLSHHEFLALYDFLCPSDVLVVNNTEVVPCRLFGHKETGGRVEVLILDYARGIKKSGDGTFVCECLIKASKRLKEGASLFFDHGLKAGVISFNNGIYTVAFSCGDDFERLLYLTGHVPLPPYIKRNGEKDPCNDKIAYQTVYASAKGAIAAPTAGLHFSERLMGKLQSKGIRMVAITLHVGYGTFLPVRVSDIRDHKIHSEEYSISKEDADFINSAKSEGRRIVAVGTTTVRTLEYMSDNDGNVAHGSGSCDLFIYPGYSFKVVDAMITNFHLPQSTLLMLVSAFAGRSNVLNAYKEAINAKYRFYSYGDAMMIA